MPTLNWIGKDAVVNHHRQVPYHLLRCDSKLSAGEPGSGNLLVQGDNLLALKALLPYYAGQVKCIYIDPPYNTGNENWVYNDNVNSPEMQKWLGKVVGKEAEDLSRHDKWLCMMYPRLALLREFLTKDGLIFVSLDDNEIGPLRLLMDEILGQSNFLAQIIVEANRRGQTYKQISKTHEYLLCYSRSEKTILNEIETGGENLDKQDEWGAYSARELRNRNPKFGRSNRPNLFYPVYVDTTPANSEGHHRVLADTTGNMAKVLPLNSKGGESCWRWGQPKLYAAVEKGLQIVFAAKTRSGKWRIFEKYRKETKKPKSLWTDTEFISEQGTNLLRELGMGEQFQFPKPVALVERIIQIATQPDDIVMDSFAGSGTTGHAVLAANKADGGNRRFILVEMEEDICRNVATQRLAQAIGGYQVSNSNGKTKEVSGLGGGFRYCKLSRPIFDEGGNINPEVKFADLAAHVFFTETGEPIPKRADGKTPLIGVCNATAYYLLYNGVLGDKRVNGGNVLTSKILAKLPAHDGPKVIYGEGCRLGANRLKRENIVFKQVPYEIKVS